MKLSLWRRGRVWKENYICHSLGKIAANCRWLKYQVRKIENKIRRSLPRATDCLVRDYWQASAMWTIYLSSQHSPVLSELSYLASPGLLDFYFPSLMTQYQSTTNFYLELDNADYTPRYYYITVCPLYFIKSHHYNLVYPFCTFTETAGTYKIEFKKIWFPWKKILKLIVMNWTRVMIKYVYFPFISHVEQSPDDVFTQFTRQTDTRQALSVWVQWYDWRDWREVCSTSCCSRHRVDTDSQSVVGCDSEAGHQIIQQRRTEINLFPSNLNLIKTH